MTARGIKPAHDPRGQHPLQPDTFSVAAGEAKRSGLRDASNMSVADLTAAKKTRMEDGMPVPRVTPRERLSTRFLQDFQNHWAIYGRQALHQFYQADPGAYCRLAGSLIPKHIDVRAGGIDEFRRLSSDEVRALMREAVREALAEQGATVDGEHEYIVDEQVTILCGPQPAGQAGDAQPGPADGAAEVDPSRGIDQGDVRD